MLNSNKTLSVNRYNENSLTLFLIIIDYIMNIKIMNDYNFIRPLGLTDVMSKNNIDTTLRKHLKM